jgi:hypothetical protein
MPSSRPNTIPAVIHLVRQLKPNSILDVGVGFGKWGHLFREYTDILAAEHDPPRYRRENWKVRIDGIEGHAPYLTPMHEYFYDKIHIGDACELLANLPPYDLIFLGDIIEHFDKAKGRKLLREAYEHALKALIVTTPKYETAQEGLCGNELERHRSLWSAKDFAEFPGSVVKTIDRATLIAVLPRPGVPPLDFTFASPKSSAIRRLGLAAQEITKRVPLEQVFVLVDEEQLRGLLPHRKALPFLQKEGEYWGPPPDDETAIQQLEQLRQAGAARIVFVWPCFWWLDHYATFNRYLRDQFPTMLENKKVIIFDLERRRA